MEQLLLILFLVFSVGSALLERRKRKRQQEEAQQRQQDRGEGAPPPQAQEKEDEGWGGWPFPMGGDPFERPKPQPVTQSPEQEDGDGDGDVVVMGDSAPPLTGDGLTLVEQLEQQAREAERNAQEGEEQPLQMVRPARRVSELVRERLAASTPAKPKRRRRRGGSRWALTAQSARDAVVYIEILGPCKAQRDEEL